MMYIPWSWYFYEKRTMTLWHPQSCIQRLPKHERALSQLDDRHANRRARQSALAQVCVIWASEPLFFHTAKYPPRTVSTAKYSS
jgi:hypothetical protein